MENINTAPAPAERERTADEVFSEIKDDMRELSKALENQPDNEKIKKYIELNNAILNYMFEEKSMDGEVSHETLQALGQVAQNVAPAPTPEMPPVPETPIVQDTTPTPEQAPSVEVNKDLASQPKASVEALISDIPKADANRRFVGPDGLVYSTPEEARGADWNTAREQAQ